MKKYLLFVVVLMISFGAFCQEKERKFTVMTNPVFLFADLFMYSFAFDGLALDLEGQYKINDSINFALDLSAIYRAEDGDESASNVNLEPMFIWRPFKTGLEGFFLGLYPSIGLVWYNNFEKTDILTQIGFGFGAGYKWIFRNGFTMQVGSKFGRAFAIPKNQDFDDYYSDINLGLKMLDLMDFKLGYSF